jgi:membrane protease YdiL (CAAX protease family)
MLLWHFLAFVLIVAGPILDLLTTPGLKRSKNPHKRLYWYSVTLVASCVLGVLSWLAIGPEILKSPFGVPGTPGTIVAYAVSAALLVFCVTPIFMMHRRPELKKAIAKALVSMEFVVPHNNLERAFFGAVSVSAGVNEELLFRGFLPRYFLASPLHLNIWLGAVLSCVFFGFNHLYQGKRGVPTTAAIGAMFMVMVGGFGWLIPAMILHAVVDLRMVFFPFPEAPSPQAT